MTVSRDLAATDSARPQLPGLWRFFWMFWMQPILLHQRLKACGIDEPDSSAIRLWRTDDEFRDVRRQYVSRLMAVLILGTPFFGFGLALILDVCGITVDYADVAVGVAEDRYNTLTVLFGSVLIQRASEESIRLLLTPVIGTSDVDALIRRRNELRTSGTASLDVPHSSQSLVTEQSACHSLWIVDQEREETQYDVREWIDMRSRNTSFRW